METRPCCETVDVPTGKSPQIMRKICKNWIPKLRSKCVFFLRQLTYRCEHSSYGSVYVSLCANTLCRKIIHIKYVSVLRQYACRCEHYSCGIFCASLISERKRWKILHKKQRRKVDASTPMGKKRHLILRYFYVI